MHELNINILPPNLLSSHSLYCRECVFLPNTRVITHSRVIYTSRHRDPIVLSQTDRSVGMEVKGLQVQLWKKSGGGGGDFGVLGGVSDTLASAPRAQQDQCVWSGASSPHNEGKWEFNTNFLTMSRRPPASGAGLTSRHPQLRHHHLFGCNHNKMSETTNTDAGACPPQIYCSTQIRWSFPASCRLLAVTL